MRLINRAAVRDSRDRVVAKWWLSFGNDAYLSNTATGPILLADIWIRLT